MPDLIEQLQAVFDAEAREHLDALSVALSDARKGLVVDMREVFRRAHSIKGAARAVDAAGIESAAHDLEALLSDISGVGEQARVDRLRDAQELVDSIEAFLAARRQASTHSVGERDGAADPEAAAPQPDFTRVNSEHIQSLSGTLTEVLSELDALGGLPDRLRELQQQAAAISRALSRIAIETERSGRKSVLPGVVLETSALARGLADFGRDQRDVTFSLSRSAARLGQNVAQVSMARADEVFAGLHRMVEDAAIAAGLDVNIRFEGLQIEAGRRLLQTLRDPVLHLLRNSIAHGMEAPDDRARGGKARKGTIGLRLRVNGGRLEVIVWDDGRGPDLSRIEEIAIQRGLLAPRGRGQPSPTEEHLLTLVFEAGFSTRGEVDRMSGRGMGLSVVAEAARAAGGGAFMKRREGGGVETTLSAPLSMSRQTLLLIEAGGQVFAVPSTSVAALRRIAPGHLQLVDGRPVFDDSRGGNQGLIPYVPIGSLLSQHADESENVDARSVAILKQGSRRLGIGVSALAGVREAMVTPMPPNPLSTALVRDIVTGIAQLDMGRIALVLSADEMFDRFNRDLHGAAARIRAAEPGAERRRTTVLVVDDSITTRTLEKSILEAHGYRVVLAVDGLEALTLLREGGEQIDLVITDVEMPRMDGFQLLSALKADSQLAGLPVVVMTSRGDPEDVRRGLDLGADAYVAKQSFDQRELLSIIGQLA